MSVVAERAVLASRQPAGNYSVATSRWGGTDRALAAVCTGTHPETLPSVDWRVEQSRVDFPAVAAAIDVLGTEIVYRVDESDTTVFLSLWFGLPLASTIAVPGSGALVSVGSVADARAIRRWFRTAKGTLADAVTAGVLPYAVTSVVLATIVTSLPDRESYLCQLPEPSESL